MRLPDAGGRPGVRYQDAQTSEAEEEGQRHPQGTGEAHRVADASKVLGRQSGAQLEYGATSAFRVAIHCPMDGILPASCCLVLAAAQTAEPTQPESN